MNGNFQNLDYENINPFFNGLAIVRNTNNNYGMINKEGQLIIDTIYQDIETNFNEIISVKKEYKWSFINAENQIIIDEQYYEVNPFYGNYAIVKDAYYGAIDTTGKIIIPLIYEDLENLGSEYFIFENGKQTYEDDFRMGLLNANGDTLLFGDYESIFVFEDYAEVERNGRVGVIKLSTMELIIPFVFEELNYDEDGLTRLVFTDSNDKEYLGYLNKKATIVWSNNRKLLKEKLRTKHSLEN